MICTSFYEQIHYNCVFFTLNHNPLTKGMKTSRGNDRDDILFSIKFGSICSMLYKRPKCISKVP